MRKAGRAKTRILETGSLKKNSAPGFTLLELIIVMFIVVLMTGILTVRILGVLSGGDLRLASRMVIGEFNTLRGKAVSTRQSQTLILNIDKDALYSIAGISTKQDLGAWGNNDGQKTIPKAGYLPQGVLFEDVVLFDKEKIQEGEARVRFYANGCVDRALIHLRNENNEVYTLEVNPLTGHVRIYDSYVEKIYGE